MHLVRPLHLHFSLEGKEKIDCYFFEKMKEAYSLHGALLWKEFLKDIILLCELKRKLTKFGL